MCRPYFLAQRGWPKLFFFFFFFLLSDNGSNFAGETQEINDECMDQEKKMKGWLPTKESIGSLKELCHEIQQN